MVWLVKGFTIAPTYFYRSPLPVQTITGVDANLNRREQRPPGARLQVHGRRRGAGGHRRLRDLELQPRRVAHADEPARLARFRLGGQRRGIEAIGEVFNLLNAKNPAFTIVNNQTSAPFMQPDAYRGRLPAARAARRPDRLPLLVLVRIDDSIESDWGAVTDRLPRPSSVGRGGVWHDRLQICSSFCNSGVEPAAQAPFHG